MKLFSLGRTDLAVSSKLPTPVGLVKCRRTIIVLRTSVMVWYTWRSHWTVVFAHCVQSWCDARPASPRFMIQLWMIWYSSCFHVEEITSTCRRYISLVHSMQHLPRFVRKDIHLDSVSYQIIELFKLAARDWHVTQTLTTRPHTPLNRAPPTRKFVIFIDLSNSI